MKRAGPPRAGDPHRRPAGRPGTRSSNRRKPARRRRHHRQQQSLLNEPKPAPTAPSTPTFDTGPQTAGDAIRQAERDAARNRGVRRAIMGKMRPPTRG